MESKEIRFMSLMEDNKGILYKICKIYQEDADDRNDLLQEMLLQLWLAFDSYRAESRFSTWMYRVALNTAILFFKNQKRRPDSEKLPVDFEAADDAAQGNETDHQLAFFYKAVKLLGQVDKALIYLYMENMPYEEISTNLGITPANVRVRISRLKTKLKELIKTLNDEY